MDGVGRPTSPKHLDCDGVLAEVLPVLEGAHVLWQVADTLEIVNLEHILVFVKGLGGVLVEVALRRELGRRRREHVPHLFQRRDHKVGDE